MDPVVLTSETVVPASMITLEPVELESPRALPPTTSTRISPAPRNTPLRDTHGNSLAVAPVGDAKGVIVATPTMDSTDISDLSIQNGHVENGHVDDDEEDIVLPVPKRKRSSVNYNQDDPDPWDEPAVKRSKPAQKIRGVIIGVWRDSDQPNDADKHVVFGFMDNNDRLRTRIYGMNRRDEELIGNIPVGVGGCWVTFPRIIFDSHLSSLSAQEIKEYVRARGELRQGVTEEERQEANMKAVLRAQSVVQAAAAAAVAAAAQENVSPATKAVVQRASNSRPSQGRQSLPRQSLNNTPSFKAVNVATTQSPKSSPLTDAKPTGVLLGYWADSCESRPEDKHAVYGVLGGTDCFRVKVQRVTRDGRFVDGNFPVGAGALWLHYDRVVFEPQLVGMTRPEVKEYVRIRQRELAEPETEKERKVNEANAIKRAKEIVAAEEPNNGIEQTQPSPNTSQPSPSSPPNPDVEVRHSSRTYAARQQAEADAAAAAQKLRKEKAEARERQIEKTRKEVAVAEAAVQEAAQQELRNNIKKLNKVWVAQQAATVPGAVPDDGAKYHNGIKYERKQNGPFQGKLVSSAQILSIDGEDYVEYRVLTKPSFF